jgi:hypothetical protein
VRVAPPPRSQGPIENGGAMFASSSRQSRHEKGPASSGGHAAWIFTTSEAAVAPRRRAQTIASASESIASYVPSILSDTPAHFRFVKSWAAASLVENVPSARACAAKISGPTSFSTCVSARTLAYGPAPDEIHDAVTVDVERVVHDERRGRRVRNDFPDARGEHGVDRVVAAAVHFRRVDEEHLGDAVVIVIGQCAKGERV